jgi:sec-independent protein translocase protein TatC
VIRKKNQANQQKQNKLKQNPTAELTFLEHIYELRKRLFWVVVTLLLTSAIGLQCKDLLIEIVMAPLKGGKLIYLTPGGGFSFIFTLCLYSGALFTIPVAVYHIYKFLQPMLKNTSRRFIVSFMLISTLLSVVGASFGYFLAIPAAINFLNNFAGDAVVASLTADSYLSFVVSYMLGLAVLFQLPLLLFLFDHIKPFPPGALQTSQRYVIVAATILAALITPTPDMFNMAIVAGPIVVVYEFGALAVYARRRSRNKALKANRKVEPMAKKAAEPISANKPLTAMIEELDTYTKQASVTYSVNELTTASSTPAIQATSQSIIAPNNIPPVQPRHSRSMDGFRIVDQHKTNVRVPTRDQQPSRLTVQQRPQTINRGRSIDGFSAA